LKPFKNKVYFFFKKEIGAFKKDLGAFDELQITWPIIKIS